MMKKIIVIVCVLLSFSSCKSSKHTKKQSKPTITQSKSDKRDDIHKDTTHTNISNPQNRLTPEKRSNLASEITDYAKQFDGVRYKYGGTTKSGMDCSGLVYVSFKAYDVNLPRVSRDMAKQGVDVTIEELQEGDLLFFETNPRKKEISHVGLVVAVRPGLVQFIHATTKGGVLISSLAERYWYTSFVKAKRIL